MWLQPPRHALTFPRRTPGLEGDDVVQFAGRAIIYSALDNLAKGASGQAVQNMNLMLGFPETMRLEQVALFP